MQYDIAGNQTQLADTSAGRINYTYTGFGELLTQKSARNLKDSLIYNSNGTISQKITPEGTTSYVYNAQKQLTSISSPGGVSRTFGYDTKGRISSITEVIPGSSNLVTSYTYAKCGRDSLITHPSGIVERRNYNSYGYLNSISTVLGTNSTTRWTNSTMNAYQQVTSGQYGPSLGATFGFDSYGFPTSIAAGAIQSFKYRFDQSTGNLISRRNRKVAELRDSVTYDNLDRIDNIYKGMTTPVRTFDISYDANKGGINFKDSIGTLNYNNSNKPYALSSVNQIAGGPIPTALDSVSYTSFESVNTILEGDILATFTYNSDNERAKMEVKQSGNVILTRWYSSSGYIKETSGGVTKEYTFIGGDAYSAPCVSVRQQGSSNRFYYLLRDHLGSITHVSDSTAGTLYEYSYDAWGRMRNPTTWNYYSAGTEPALFIAGRGFTGHEHLPWFNMINMNGRLYDPLTGQFLSPDNNVQMPDYTQNLNRYAYCLNNPLRYKDENGEWVITLLTMLANMYLNTSAANDWQFNPAKWDWESPKTWSSLIQSGISGYYMGTELEKYAKGQFQSASYSSDQNQTPDPDRYKSPGNHDAEIPRMQRRYAYNYRNNISHTFTDGTAPTNYEYDSDYGSYTYTGESTSYIKHGKKYVGGITVPIGNNKFDIYISPRACDYEFSLVYKHEVSHVALDLGKFTNVFYQESAIYNKMWEVTKNKYYYEQFLKYGGSFPVRYKTIVDQIFDIP
jgi:RHS repeat-associated protein